MKLARREPDLGMRWDSCNQHRETFTETGYKVACFAKQQQCRKLTQPRDHFLYTDCVTFGTFSPGIVRQVLYFQGGSSGSEPKKRLPNIEAN